jgi:hypothetical protein
MSVWHGHILRQHTEAIILVTLPNGKQVPMIGAGRLDELTKAQKDDLIIRASKPREAIHG